LNQQLIVLLASFLLALGIALALTPASRRIGQALGAYDQPNERKAHWKPIPRTGGMAIVVSFLAALFLINFAADIPVSRELQDRSTVALLAGGLVVFGIGFLDDLRRLPAWLKFAFQILGAGLAYLGGIRITGLLGVPLNGFWGLPSMAVTVFWFILFINAINLIDGLDGLAAGVVFFACMVMTILCLWTRDVPSALPFSTLAGASLGFLRYNFNPASIFMGDGGSYFLGYVVAGLSIATSVKSQVSAVILIPLVALGVPVFDTVLSPIRRFVMGKSMFRPDNGHIHHRLISMGLSTRRAVWSIYAISMVLCTFSLGLVYLHNLGVGVFLLSLGVVAILFMRKLGYLEYLAIDKVQGWIKDVTDEAGFSHDRRSFLNLQLEIEHSGSAEELWGNVCQALKMLDFDMSELHLNHRLHGARAVPSRAEGGCAASTQEAGAAPGPDDYGGNGAEPPLWVWQQNGFCRDKDLCRESLLKFELPLLSPDHTLYGTLWLVKDLQRSPCGHFTLRRVEHLRRCLTRAMEKLGSQEAGKLGSR
jgi:UDP-GlcNAc:undecaprenyl-phosphate GlcNAc-1-phosphate transferase